MKRASPLAGYLQAIRRRCETIFRCQSNPVFLTRRSPRWSPVLVARYHGADIGRRARFDGDQNGADQRQRQIALLQRDRQALQRPGLVGEHLKGIRKTEDEACASPQRERKPDRVLQRDPGRAAQGHRGTKLALPLAPVPLDAPLHCPEQVVHTVCGQRKPHHTRPASAFNRMSTSKRGLAAGDVVKFLRPDLDRKSVEPTLFEIENDSLTGLSYASVPTQEGKQPKDSETKVISSHFSRRNRPVTDCGTTRLSWQWDGLGLERSRLSPLRCLWREIRGPAATGMGDIEGDHDGSEAVRTALLGVEPHGSLRTVKLTSDSRRRAIASRASDILCARRRVVQRARCRCPRFGSLRNVVEEIRQLKIDRAVELVPADLVEISQQCQQGPDPLPLVPRGGEGTVRLAAALQILEPRNGVSEPGTALAI